MTSFDQPATHPAPSPRPVLGRVGQLLCGIFGGLLPLITLGVEFFTHMCAEFFDPIPTPVHGAAIALVGVANLCALRILLLRPVTGKNLTRMAQLNALAMGIGFFYSLWFAWLTPFAAIAVIFFGIGFLPLSPLLSLAIAWFLRGRLRRQAEGAGLTLPRVWPAFFAAFGLLVAMEIPGFVQAWAVQAVDRGGSEEQARGLWVLRRALSEEQLLRGCYYRTDEERDTVHSWFFGRVTLENRQRIYYRVTGRQFNHRPPPERGWSFPGRGAARDTEEWVWDSGQGGDGVGQRLKALTLTQSRLDGTVDGDAALGYLEWTMVFRNDHEFQQREARAVVQLPAGAVVSRLTLWIDGEEREAAFGGRSQVRQAYQAVVNRRRDPVLVTAKGPDRVLVQCFPVEPKGKEMKIRLGITTPLILDGLDSARFTLPRVVEQNFSAAAGLSHTVWIESSQALTSELTDYRHEISRGARHALRGELSPAQFGSFSSGIAVHRNPSVTNSWTRNPLDDRSIVTQKITRQPAPAGPLFIVLDGSNDLGPVAPVLADALDRLPENFPVRLGIAGDRVQICPASDPRAVALWLRDGEFAGGQDASAALQAALDGLGTQGGTVLWIHGAQPVSWLDTGVLEQNLARRAGRVRLFSLSAITGPNLLLEKLGESPDLVVAPRLGYFKEDLTRTLDRLQNGSFVAQRQVQPVGEQAEAEASSHLARLWAAGEVARMLAGGQGNREAAVALAVKMQLVTALSGAVVLETKQQYDAAGLQAVDPKTVPHTVPDGSSTLLLLLVAGLALLHMWARCRIGRAARVG
ncbi:MAG TPA: VIT domain-containing protein [Lacunisphaera sp.]